MNFHLKGMSHLEKKIVNYTPIAYQTVEDVLLNMFVIFSQRILRIHVLRQTIYGGRLLLLSPSLLLRVLVDRVYTSQC